MTNFHSFTGTVTRINDFFTGQSTRGCIKLFTVENEMGGIVNFVVSPSTYVVDQLMVKVGDKITGYYDGDAPAILIYPPQYPALVIVKDIINVNVKVDHFNRQLVSSDGKLRLNIAPYTRFELPNGQQFTGNPGNRDLVVIYGPTTFSIPAQTTPYRVIVLCLGG